LAFEASDLERIFFVFLASDLLDMILGGDLTNQLQLEYTLQYTRILIDESIFM
jgi:hypothetical protein